MHPVKLDGTFLKRQQPLVELMSRQISALDLAVMMIDGIERNGRTMTVALGVSSDGVKIPLGLWEGSTENATAAAALLSDLIERGLDPEQGTLLVVDGADALYGAIRRAFGEAPVQRCIRHKERNVLRQVPERDRRQVQARLRRAWAELSYRDAREQLRRLAKELDHTHPDAAASLEEGLEETLTVIRLGIRGKLRRTLESTSACESLMNRVRLGRPDVARPSSAGTDLRCAAAGMLEAEKQFHKVIGYLDLPQVAVAVQRDLARRHRDATRRPACEGGIAATVHPSNARLRDRLLRRAAQPRSERKTLMGLMLLSIVALGVTIGLKLVAWRLTRSAGLLSDALESGVNLAAALLGFATIAWATRPPDERHVYGHEKAEYFSAGAEGALIVAAAAFVTGTAVSHLLDPRELTDLRDGLAVSATGSLIALVVGGTLVRAGTRRRSIAVQSHGRHLMTDVVVSAGVIVGVGGVAVTGWSWLDPLAAMGVAVSLVVTGTSLLRASVVGLMDPVIPPAEQAALDHVLARYRSPEVQLRSIRTRQAGRRSFVSVDLLVPPGWRVRRAHELTDRLEQDVLASLPYAAVSTHIEPLASLPKPRGGRGSRPRPMPAAASLRNRSRPRAQTQLVTPTATEP